jgi:transglutaminase-like putative cysteine protease
VSVLRSFPIPSLQPLPGEVRQRGLRRAGQHGSLPFGVPSRGLLGACILAAMMPAVVWGVENHVPVGARALGMGCAYTAVADDATAPFWNPAGLLQLGAQEFVGSHANLFNAGLNLDYVGLAAPLSARQAAAIHLNHLGYDDDELAFGETQLGLAWAVRPARWLAVGAGGRYTSRDTRLDGSSEGRGGGFGGDLGLMATPMPSLRLGVVSQDLVETRVRYGDGSQSRIQSRNLRVGAAWSPFRGATVALDVDDRVHGGAEVKPMQQVALRGGLEVEPGGEEGVGFSTGVGIEVGVLRFDYAYVQRPVLGATSHFQLATSFNFNPPLVRIEEVRANDLYASLYKSYVWRPVANVRLRSLADHPVTVRVAATAAGVTEAPVEREIIVGPRATQDLDMTTVLSPRIMERREIRQIQLNISARYQSRRLPREEHAIAAPFLYAPGAINWSQGVEQAAAFVTPRDPVVENLAVQACRIAADLPYYTPELRQIAAVLDALAVTGLTYVTDARMPYAIASTTPHAVDTVRYPRETLAVRAGDCDDTAVLVASLLGSAGVATKFADAPGHLFLIANTGLRRNERAVLGLPDSVLRLQGQEVWIPVETTHAGDGFIDAWQEGMASLSRGPVSFVDVDSSRARYMESEFNVGKPLRAELDTLGLRRLLEVDARRLRARPREALLGSSLDTTTRLVASRQALERLSRICAAAGRQAEAARYRDWKSPPVEPMEMPEHSRKEIHFGVAMALTRSLAEAESAFVSALSHSGGNTSALVNLGNLYVVKGDPELGAAFYAEALKTDSTKVGTTTNLAIAQLLAGDVAAAGQAAESARRLVGGRGSLANALDLDGLVNPEEGARAGLPRELVEAGPGPFVEEMALRRLFGIGGAVRTTRDGPVEPSPRSGAERSAVEVARVLDWPF